MPIHSVTKITINQFADQALNDVLKRINQDFGGGRINKSALASWLLTHSIKGLNDSTVDAIRKAHFNQTAYLENLVKRMKQLGRESLTAEELTELKVALGGNNQKTKTPLKNRDSDT